MADHLSVASDLWVRLRARRCRDPLLADTFVVDDPGRCGLLRRLAAALKGGHVCTVEFLETGGHSGCSLAFHRAVSLPRCIWVSGRFQRQYEQAFLAIQQGCQGNGSKWKLLPTCHDFLSDARGR